MDRRRTPRRVPTIDEPLSRVRLRGGREMAVRDVSAGGALIEGTSRLHPGTHVDVHVVTTDGRFLVRGRVLRAWVCYLDAAVVRYRVALAFEQHVDTAPVPQDAEPASFVAPP